MLKCVIFGCFLVILRCKFLFLIDICRMKGDILLKVNMFFIFNDFINIYCYEILLFN